MFVSNTFRSWCHSFQTVLNDLSKEVGSKVTIGNFIRMEVGEGIERYDIFVLSHVISMDKWFFVCDVQSGRLAVDDHMFLAWQN